ncbi:MAG: hypothetical protein AB8F74_20900 [Saprospiraceae bacterium]
MLNNNIKRSLLHLIAILFIGCNLSSSKSSSFTGNWRLIKSNGIHFNVPPLVKLNEIDRTLSSKQSKTELTLTGNRVVFSYDSLNYFKETEFIYKIFHENEIAFLELVSLKNNNRYILSRE